MIDYNVSTGKDSIYFSVTLEIDIDSIDFDDGNTFEKILNLLNYLKEFYDSIQYQKQMSTSIRCDEYDYSEENKIIFNIHLEIMDSELPEEVLSLVFKNRELIELKGGKQTELNSKEFEISYEYWSLEKEIISIDIEIEKNDSLISDMIKEIKIFSDLEKFIR